MTKKNGMNIFQAIGVALLITVIVCIGGCTTVIFAPLAGFGFFPMWIILSIIIYIADNKA